MELILSRPGMLRTFTMEWKTKWVPAIIGYSKNLKKKDMSDLLACYDLQSLGKHRV